MIRLVHLSDIHFGGENVAAVKAAADFVNAGAFDLAVVSLTLSEKLLQDKGGREPFLAFGLGLLLLAAGLFFSYFRKMHLATFEIANCLLTLDTARAREIPKDVWTEHKTGYIAAYVVQLLGLALLIACYVAA